MRYFIASEEEIRAVYGLYWKYDTPNNITHLEYLLGAEIGELEYSILKINKSQGLKELGLEDFIPTEGREAGYNYCLYDWMVIAKDIPDPEFRLEDEDKNTIKKMKGWFDEILYQD